MQGGGIMVEGVHKSQCHDLYYARSTWYIVSMDYINHSSYKAYYIIIIVLLLLIIIIGRIYVHFD